MLSRHLGALMKRSALRFARNVQVGWPLPLYSFMLFRMCTSYIWNSITRTHMALFPNILSKFFLEFTFEYSCVPLYWPINILFPSCAQATTLLKSVYSQWYLQQYETICFWKPCADSRPQCGPRCPWTALTFPFYISQVPLHSFHQVFSIFQIEFVV